MKKFFVGILFWLRRFVLVFCVACAMIVNTHLLRSHELAVSLSRGLLWSTISANVFIFTRIYRSRNGGYCALCNDLPVIQNGK